jgi:hypothetical protein
VDSKELIKFYNALVSLMVEGRFRPARNRRGGFKRFTEKNLREAEDLLSWFGDEAFAVRPYLAGAFGDHNWCYQPKFERLRQKRYQDAYRDGTAWKWWEILEREDRFAEKPTGPHPGHEIIKARYFSEYRNLGGAMCYESRLAGRFDGQSKFCRQCDKREVCKHS